ncbi:MAG: zinc-binding dehydrogenase [Bacillota bacterium]|nr:zinc-binding dehydrogenase [Bacillota bacterium]
MKAAVVHDANQLVIEDIPMPVLNPYAALCKILYGATCTATDMHIISHTVIKTSYPTLLGHESIGEVLECGRKVRHFKVGDRLTNVGVPPLPALDLHSFGGGFAEYGLAFDYEAMRIDGLSKEEILNLTTGPRQPSSLVPEDIPSVVAPLLITWRETWSYLTRMGMKQGLRVLVIGSGGNGLSFICHARALQAGLIVAVGSEHRRDLALACGADEYQCYKDDSLIEHVRQAATGYDLVVDAIGASSGMNPYLRLLAPDAVVGIYGIEGRQNMSLNPMAAAHSFRFYKDGYREIEAHQPVIENIRAGFLQASHFYATERPYPLVNLQDAFDMLRRKEMPKALIQMHDLCTDHI